MNLIILNKSVNKIITIDPDSILIESKYASQDCYKATAYNGCTELFDMLIKNEGVEYNV